MGLVRGSHGICIHSSEDAGANLDSGFLLLPIARFPSPSISPSVLSGSSGIFKGK